MVIMKAYLKNSLLQVTFSASFKMSTSSDQDVMFTFLFGRVVMLASYKVPCLACASSRFQRDAKHTICQHRKSPSIYTSFIIHRSTGHTKRMDAAVHCEGSSRNPQSCWPQHNSCAVITFTCQDICSNT